MLSEQNRQNHYCAVENAETESDGIHQHRKYDHSEQQQVNTGTEL